MRGSTAWRSCAMRPENRRKVRGMRIWGETSISTPASVPAHSLSSPALLSGESSRMSMHWCKMSGRASAGSRLCLRRKPAWSSPRSTCSLPTLPTSRHALLKHHDHLRLCRQVGQRVGVARPACRARRSAGFVGDRCWRWLQQMRTARSLSTGPPRCESAWVPIRATEPRTHHGR